MPEAPDNMVPIKGEDRELVHAHIERHGDAFIY